LSALQLCVSATVFGDVVLWEGVVQPLSANAKAMAAHPILKFIVCYPHYFFSRKISAHFQAISKKKARLRGLQTFNNCGSFCL
jgi:hypothetical protein